MFRIRRRWLLGHLALPFLLLASSGAIATQTTPLAAGSTAASSTTVTTDSNVVFTAFGDWKNSRAQAVVQFETGNSETKPACVITADNPRCIITGAPGSYHVDRPLLPSGATVGFTADVSNTNGGTGSSVTVTSSALPTGASTSSKQDTLDGHVTETHTTVGSAKYEQVIFSGANGLAPAGPSYRTWVAGNTFYATPTDLVCLSGSNTKVVIPTLAALLIGSTASSFQTIDWYRRTTLNSGGTPVPLTIQQESSSTVPATATVTTWTAAPSLGTGSVLSTVWGSTALLTAVPATYTFGNIIGLTNATNWGGPVVLNNANESLCANFRGAAWPSGGTAVIVFAWREL